MATAPGGSSSSSPGCQARRNWSKLSGLRRRPLKKISIEATPLVVGATTLSGAERSFDEIVQGGRARVERELAQHALTRGGTRVRAPLECLADGRRDRLGFGRNVDLDADVAHNLG